MMLERTRAECDECYCDDCYRDVHSGGKRSTHRWIGFGEGGPVCHVCARSPAETECADCGNGRYCNSCFRVFHAKGHKKKHKHTPVLELPTYLENGTKPEYCHRCKRRGAAYGCESPGCDFRGCDSCYLCIHQPECARERALQNSALLSRFETTVDEPVDAQHLHVGHKNAICAICGEPADQRCVQCGDLYCSRTWMGNAGCFLQVHDRGNRMKHVTEKLINPEEIEAGEKALRLRQAKARKRMKELLGGGGETPTSSVTPEGSVKTMSTAGNTGGNTEGGTGEGKKKKKKSELISSKRERGVSVKAALEDESEGGPGQGSLGLGYSSTSETEGGVGGGDRLKKAKRSKHTQPASDKVSVQSTSTTAAR